MICSSCGFDSPAGMAFCGRCGTRLEQRCPSCSAEVPEGFAFCGRCGVRLADGPLRAPTHGRGSQPTEAPRNQPPPPRADLPRGERRIVTVLFADLSGFTQLAGRIDPEELAALLQDCFGELREEVRARDGWLAKYIGDAILAVFGAPVAHEDDPVRAVRVALAMQARMRSINRRMERQLLQPLHLHIGVNTGLVVAGPSVEGGDSGPDPADFTVLGDAVNVGARLQQVAEAGQVFVGESTYAATRWAFDYRKLPPLELKGKQERVIAYECLGPRAQPLPQRGVEGVQVPLLGRDRELQQLLEILDACRHGRPQIVSVVGDAGIGKSRLVREFLTRVHASGMLRAEQSRIAFATTDRPEPFGVARQLFAQSALGQDDGTPAHQLRLLLDPASNDSDPGGDVLDPEHRKQRLYLLAHQAVAAQATETPLLLVVEDLHWADESSLDLLRSLAARPGQLKLMVLLTHRPEFPGTAVWSTRASVHSIALAPLPDELSLQLVRTYVGESLTEFAPSIVEMLLERAEGNPFYLEELVRSELVRSLVQRGVLEREERLRVVLPTDQTSVPGSIQGLVLARMDRLEAETRLLLQEASVLGHSFPARLLVEFATLQGDLNRRLQELVDGEWLEPTGDPLRGEISYCFHHTLIREVAYESLLVRTRTTLHRQAAEVIETLYANRLDEFVPHLAEHYYRARDAERGVAYLQQAGDRARAMYANAEATTCYRRALELLPEDHEAERGRLAVALGDAFSAQGRFDEAVESWRQAMGWYETRGAPDQVVMLHRRIAAALWSKGRVEDAQRHLAAGLGRLDGQVETEEAAALYQELANQALHRGDCRAAIEWAQQALDLSQRLQAHEQASLTATTLGIALARSGDVERGRESVEQALRIATEHSLPLAAGRAAANLAVIYANLDPLRAGEICEQGLAEARRVGDVAIQPWFLTALAGALHACAGDYEAAIRAAETAIELDRQLGLRAHLPVPLIVLGQIHQCHSRLAEAEACYQEALSLAEELSDPQLLFPCLEGLGTLYFERGHKELGQACLDRARSTCEAAGFSVQEMVLLPFLY